MNCNYTLSQKVIKPQEFILGKNSYRVFVLDSYTEFQDEKYFDSEEDAEVFAEDWVLKNE